MNELGYESQEVRQQVTSVTSIENASQPTITSFADLCRYKQGTVVTLPPFAKGQPFVARVTRPSMLMMLKSGKIPNQLMQTASKLFDGDEDVAETMLTDANAVGNMYSVMEIMCEACLIEPTYQQIKESGMNLTDEQMMAIFQYVQTGVTALEPFHQE